MTFDPSTAQLFRQNRFEPVVASRSVVDPADLSPVGQRGIVDAATVVAVVEEARTAQRLWAARDAKTRATILHQLATAIESADHDATAVLMSREMGKPWAEAMGEIANIPGALRYFAEMARDEAGKIAGTTEPGSFQFARYEPLGVSVHIMPYNFPLLLMVWTVAASLAAGNACIIKPAEATTLSTLHFMHHVANHLPPGLVSCLPGDGDTGRTLIGFADAVAFTGSAATARKVAVACAERLIPVVIEAGGNDAMIISANAPMAVAVPGACCAAFHLSGQVCTAAERIFVHEAVYDTFATALAERAAALKIAPGLGESEIGPLVSEAARAKVSHLVGEALRQGARALTGAEIPDGRNTGWWYAPTVLVNVREDMAIMKQEVFGPVASLCRVSSFEEAIAAANRSPFGLGASVFTTDLKEAMHAAEALEAGMVWVNNPLIDNDALPFGGWKASGLGRELSRMGLDAFRRAKTVIIDADPQVKDWWYPYPQSAFRKPQDGA
ncbi:MAG: aldehyde dehydrogenase family protein [Devosia sp.]